MKVIARVCGNCRFWSGSATPEETGNFLGYMSGRCRRHAPQPALEGALVRKDDRPVSYDAAWPETSDHQWCGEWEQKP